MEVAALKVSDIDSKRMMLWVEQGKGGKDRMLSPQLLELLRDGWRIARPAVWMFPGRDRISPRTTRQLNRVCHMAAERAGLPKWVAPHTRARDGGEIAAPSCLGTVRATPCDRLAIAGLETAAFLRSR
jgi:integrase